jgi:hypothetical protein
MNETRPRHKGAAPDQAPTRELARSERVRIAVGGAAAAALLSVALVGATTALGGSGGTGPGGGGDGGGGGKTAAKYRNAWEGFSHKDKKWARQTSECESGGNARIHNSGGQYHGAFQFLKSTWRSSPMSPGGDPHRYTWRTQAVVAVKLKHRDGAGHWPVCGRKTSKLFK